MIRKVVIAVSTIAVFALGMPLVNAQPGPGGGPRGGGGGGGFSGGPGFRGMGAGGYGFRAPYSRPAAHAAFAPGQRAPYFGSRFAPSPTWGPRAFPAGPYWGPRYWFWLTWDPWPWPGYFYEPWPDYYYYPYYDYDYAGYYSQPTSGYNYGDQYANPGPQSEYQQPSDKGSSQQDSTDPKKLQRQYESWITDQLGLHGKHKDEFLAKLQKLQALREDFMEKRSTLTDELADLQQKSSPETELSGKMTQIEQLDKKFQKDEQTELSSLMSTLSVSQRAKYYSLQSQYGQQQQQGQEPKP
jgi:hypothetical protein